MMSCSRGGLAWGLSTQLSWGKEGWGRKDTYVKANDFLENQWAFSKGDGRDDHVSWGLRGVPERRLYIKSPAEGIYDNCVLWEGSAFRQVKDFRDSDNFSSKIIHTPKVAYFGVTGPEPLHHQ